MVLPETGTYHITNLRIKNLSSASDGDPGSLVVGQEDMGTANQKWNIIQLNNGHYLIENFGHAAVYATCESHPSPGAPIEVGRQPKQWMLKETSPDGAILIAPLDASYLFWHLDNAQEGVPVILEYGEPDTKNHWTFKKLATI